MTSDISGNKPGGHFATSNVNISACGANLDYLFRLPKIRPLHKKNSAYAHANNSFSGTCCTIDENYDSQWLERDLKLST